MNTPIKETSSLYVTGASGLIGSALIKKLQCCNRVTYRDEVFNNFKEQENSTLIHLASFSNAQTPPSQYRECIKYDLFNTTSLFENFLKTNPEGRIIYISTAGDMYSGFADEESNVSPRSIYSLLKLYNENYLKSKKCNYLIFGVSNIWGGPRCMTRPNGLCDKILHFKKTDKPLDIYAHTESTIDLIHVDDLTDLISKAIHINIGSNKWLVGSESISIKQLLNINPKVKYNLVKNKKELTHLEINNQKVCLDFSWEPKNFLIK